MDNLVFSYNWNNKLDCKAFTTLRLHNPKKYQVGMLLNIVLKASNKSLHKGRGRITQVKTLRASQINDYIAYLDTGYPKDKCREIIRKMYPSHQDPELDFILIVKP